MRRLRLWSLGQLKMELYWRCINLLKIRLTRIKHINYDKSKQTLNNNIFKFIIFYFDCLKYALN